jgi:farnesyl-diphosphate farnesyltransferase
MADLQRLLVETSRTFALNIPFLPEPLRGEVTIAYLLFRVADTLEDADRWPRDERMAALDAFCLLLETLDEREAQQLSRKWLQHPPLQHAGYLELLAELPALVKAFAAVRPAALPIIREHTLRTAKGMKETVARSDARGGLHLETLDELQDYCYLVAGIVGEMLTELLLLDLPASPEDASALRGRARAFGEGLQLVNILKDAASDAKEGRVYLPQHMTREDVIDLARADLVTAEAYIETLRHLRAAPGIIGFHALPVRLARAALDRLEVGGPGTKVTRLEVAAILTQLQAELGEGVE